MAFTSAFEVERSPTGKWLVWSWDDRGEHVLLAMGETKEKVLADLLSGMVTLLTKEKLVTDLEASFMRAKINGLSKR